jgi:hypothetical protein
MEKVKFFEIVDGVLNNNDINDAGWKDWSDPLDMVGIYATGETLTAKQDAILQSCIDKNTESDLLKKYALNNQLEIFQNFAQNSDVFAFTNGLITQHGGHRANSGRPSLPPGEKRTMRSMKATDEEWEKIKEFARQLKSK